MPLQVVVPGAQQDEAIRHIIHWFKNPTKPWFTLAGYAGTGKTTILPNIFHSCNLQPDEVEMVCMTAIAAHRMTGKVRSMGIERHARTVHDFIYRPNVRHVQALHPDGRPILDEKGLPTYVEKLEFDDKRVGYSKRRKLKLIILDEYSMATPKVMNDLLALGIPLLLMGDLGQLPAIENGERKVHTPIDRSRPDYAMTEVHRQAKTNPILWLSELVRNGQRLTPGTYGQRNEVTVMTYADFHKNPSKRDLWLTRTDQVICGKNDTRVAINEHIRQLNGFKGRPQVGDKIICLKNERQLTLGDEQPLINGLEARIVNIVTMNRHAGRAVVDLEYRTSSGQMAVGRLPISLDAFGKTLKGNEIMGVSQNGQLGVFDYAYVKTNHKAQGNEWDNVIVLYEGLYGIDYENWVYPAMTRATKHLLFVI